MPCQHATCAVPPRWRLTDAERPGLVLYACASHLLPLLTSSSRHVLERLLEAQPS